MFPLSTFYFPLDGGWMRGSPDGNPRHRSRTWPRSYGVWQASRSVQVSGRRQIWDSHATATFQASTARPAERARYFPGRHWTDHIPTGLEPSATSFLRPKPSRAEQLRHGARSLTGKRVERIVPTSHVSRSVWRRSSPLWRTCAWKYVRRTEKWHIYIHTYITYIPTYIHRQ
ncbi:hypothetical protein BO71DRAFT_204594 [Aspergillus ellipticus CBS 707.79]|uniref:Uncharacterized protein n=1 Tax=Aspergillus ellipticus CBS 707.79 TaxID=1448320 RepID=A0A319DDZ1_9EURO|nr:hypothetical protein BO71DRAFT_204594 [Aspergillus ellipticus CBS 707.79]